MSIRNMRKVTKEEFWKFVMGMERNTHGAEYHPDYHPDNGDNNGPYCIWIVKNENYNVVATSIIFYNDKPEEYYLK